MNDLTLNAEPTTWRSIRLTGEVLMQRDDGIFLVSDSRLHQITNRHDTDQHTLVPSKTQYCLLPEPVTEIDFR